MNVWELPSALEVGGSFFQIRTDFRVIRKILKYHTDPNYEPDERAIITLRTLYADWQSVPREHYRDAIEQAYRFIDMGQSGNSGGTYRVMDWEQDAPLIIPAVNKVLGYDVREKQHLHWWTFLAAYREITDSLYSTVLHLRNKQARNEPLEKHERKFLNENHSMVTLETRYSDEDKALMEQFGITI